MRIKTIEKIRIIPPIESYNLHPYESNFDITVREINAKRKNMPMKLLKEFNTVVVLFFGGSTIDPITAPFHLFKAIGLLFSSTATITALALVTSIKSPSSANCL